MHPQGEKLLGDGFEDLPLEQAELAWEHVARMLLQAGMMIADIVKVTQYLTRAEDIPAYAKVRTHFLGDVRPASMLLVIPQLVQPLRCIRRYRPNLVVSEDTHQKQSFM